jgi:hypothetical protein
MKLGDLLESNLNEASAMFTSDKYREEVEPYISDEFFEISKNLKIREYTGDYKESVFEIVYKKKTYIFKGIRGIQALNRATATVLNDFDKDSFKLIKGLIKVKPSDLYVKYNNDQHSFNDNGASVDIRFKSKLTRQEVAKINKAKSGFIRHFMSNNFNSSDDTMISGYNDGLWSYTIKVDNPYLIAKKLKI